MQRRFGLKLNKEKEKKKAPPIKGPKKRTFPKKGQKMPFIPRGPKMFWAWTHRGYSFMTENNVKAKTSKLYVVDTETGGRTFQLTADFDKVREASKELVNIFIAEEKIAKLMGSHVGQAERLNEANGGLEEEEVNGYHASGEEEHED